MMFGKAVDEVSLTIERKSNFFVNKNLSKEYKINSLINH